MTSFLFFSFLLFFFSSFSPGVLRTFCWMVAWATPFFCIIWNVLVLASMISIPASDLDFDLHDSFGRIDAFSPEFLD